MQGHNVGGLPVMEGARLAGMVLNSHLLGASPTQRVGNVMTPGGASVSASASIREAADIMARTSCGRLPVMDGDELIGVVTDGDLLPELGRNYDPLTDLPWSDSMRAWAIDRLKHGEEITVLFVDLNDFGRFNKAHGHIVGDEVLQAVARSLSGLTDPAIDFLCRYGGDEFCIVSLRTAEDANLLAQTISHTVSEIRVQSLEGDGISCSVGQCGGKRTREREHVHYAATLNSLINLASRACTANKGRNGRASAHPVLSVSALDSGGTRLRLTRIEVVWEHRTARVQIDLQTANDELPIVKETLDLEGINRYSASQSAETDGEGVLKLVAETTILALRNFLPPGYELELTDVVLNHIATGQTIVTAVGQFSVEGFAIPVAGSAVLGDDPYRAAASCVLAAMNRPLSRIVARQKMQTGIS